MGKFPDAVTIGALSGATGVHVETIRYYEKIGLLPAPARTTGNYRVYGPDHVRRLTFVRRARDLGFPIETVRALLELADDPSRPCDDIDAIARRHLAEVQRRIADLERLRDELDRLSRQCRGGLVSDCRIIEALSPEAVEGPDRQS